MDLLFNVQWKELFLPDAPILESVIRGTVVYIAIFFLVRVIPNRQMGGVGMNDMLLIVLVASAATNSLAGDHKSITNGLVVIATVIVWSYVFNVLAFKFSSMHRLFHPEPKIIIKDGELQQENMQKELIAEKELKGKLRRQGMDDFSKVREAYIESDGQISIIER
ncbi:MAG TPA: YetF domain-containing protein [Pyrinomonadaceae bacterium]|jgi:uncharacterized membrane protein YcaP (DUF421 family)|nr:YetF domain-containing protein [Pyrinomonadaceae bacterium]